MLNDPQAIGVWATEMGQKTGLLTIGDEVRSRLGAGFPLLSLPWPVLGMAGIVLPFVSNRHVKLVWGPHAVSFAWWWSIGNLAMFSLWSVAKPNYFVPCLPGLSLLAAMTWIRLCRVARDCEPSFSRRLARVLLLAQFCVLLLCGVAAPVLSQTCLTAPPTGWLIVVATLAMLSLGVGVWIWRLGSSVRALVPFTGACAMGVWIGYGAVAPVDNPARGHRQIAHSLARLVPNTVPTIRFFHEIDEGLWFYIQGHRLAPVPGSQPQYSDTHDKLGRRLGDESAREPFRGPALRTRLQTEALFNWVHGPGRTEPFLLIRSDMYARLAPRLAGCVTPLLEETGIARKGLVLLKVIRSELRVATEETSPRR